MNDSQGMRASILKPDDGDWLDKAAREAFTEAARQAAHPQEEDWLDKAVREALSEAEKQSRVSELSKGKDGETSRPVR